MTHNYLRGKPPENNVRHSLLDKAISMALYGPAFSGPVFVPRLTTEEVELHILIYAGQHDKCGQVARASLDKVL